MKIIVLTIVIFALSGYVTRASTSLDPLENVETPDTMPNSDEDTRTKRSDFFSSILKKKLRLIGSLSNSGKSISGGGGGHSSEHFEEPLTFNTKAFNFWGVKKAIFSSVLQAAKAITGGVIALKGQLIKAKGHAVVAKGNLMQTKGEAISSFGKNIATHAFDSPHHEHGPPHHIDVDSAMGLFNHIPVTPIHQPTSYGAPSAFGYQGQAYQNNGYSSNSYPVNPYPSNQYPSNPYPSNPYPSNPYPSNPYQQVASQNYPTAFGAVQQSTGYGAVPDYSGGYGPSGFSNKRAVQSAVAQESNINQVKSVFDKDSVRAGFLIFKPIKMPQNQPLSSSPSQNVQQQTVGQLPSQLSNSLTYSATDLKTSQGNGFQNPFPAYQANGYQITGTGAGTYGQADVQQTYNNGQQYVTSYQDPGYMTQSPAGYSAQTGGYRIPVSGGGEDGGAQTAPGQQNYDFRQPTANSQEFNQQFADLSGQQQQYQQQQQQQLYDSQENNGYGDQTDSASSSDERLAPPSFNGRSRPSHNKQKPTGTTKAAGGHSLVDDFFGPTTSRTVSYESHSAFTKKRSAPSDINDQSAATAGAASSIVPLNYNDGSSADDQAKLKLTVQRFFNMLQKQRCEFTSLRTLIQHIF